MRTDGVAGFPPARFDDYEVVRPLATGAMGTVFLGRDLLLDRQVALKFIAASNPDPQAYDRFVAEARALARLHHPNVVSVYRISSVDGHPYIAYEFVDGVPLHRLPRPVPWRQVLDLAVGLSRGLAAVHESGLLHRDIKPSNAVVDRNRVVKLLDFGIAEPREIADWDEPSEVVVPLPGEGDEHFSGTPVYMAPELSVHAQATRRSDVYSLGVVLWEMLAGDLPLSDREPDEMIANILQHGLPPIGEVQRDVPPAMASLVDQCTARAAEHRPGSAVLRERFESLRSMYAPLVADLGDDALAESRAARRLIASLDRVSAAPSFGRRLYERLFAEAPELRARFRGDLTLLHAQVIETLSTVIHGARSPETVVPLLEDLGHRHYRHGVRDAELDVFGRALVATVAELDAPTWTPSLAHLWHLTYQRIAAHVRRGLHRAAAEGSGPWTIGTPPAPHVAVPSEPRYTRADDAMIAYHLVGDGPRHVVVVPGWVAHLELAWQDAGYARMLSSLARRARVVAYDRRGTGLSDRAVAGLDLASEVGDLLAVLDAAAVDRAVVFAMHDAEAIALMLAATHPERVRGVVIWGGTPSPIARGDFAHGTSAAALDGWLASVRARWGEPLALDTLAPSRARDEAFKLWWARYLRSGTTPAAVAALVRARAAVDLRAVLPAVQVPTAILRRAGDRLVSHEASAALAAGIAGARLVELPGDDHLPYTQDPAAVAAEVDGFFSDLPTTTELSVRLVTVMAVRADEPALVRRLHAAIESERGVIVDDRRGPVATFRAPAAALRALRAAHPGEHARAAILVQVVPAHGDHEARCVEDAWSHAQGAPAGRIWLSPGARDLVGDLSLAHDLL